MTTPKLALPELAVGQAGKELTHNDALAVLDQLVQARVLDKDLLTPPGSPADGAAYIVPPGASGTWTGNSGKIAYWRSAAGAWRFLTPAAGWEVWVNDENKQYRYSGSSWAEVAGGAGGGGGEAPSTGVVSGLGLSIGTPNTTISIAAGIMRHVDYTIPDLPVPTNYPLPAINNLAITGIGTRPETYLGRDRTGAVLQSANPLTETELKTYAMIGVAVHSNLSTVNAVNPTPNSVLAIGNQFQAFLKNVMGNINLEGNVISANGANLQLNKSAGILWGLGLGQQAGLLNSPNSITTAAATPLTWRYRNQNAETGDDVTLLDPTTYDLNGVTTTIPGGGGNWSVQRPHIFPSGLVRIQRGQAFYASKEEALNAIATEAFVSESNIRKNGTPIGYIIVRKGATALNLAADCEFRVSGKFGIVAGGSVALTAASIIAALGYTPENTANKVVDLATPNDTKYPTALAVSNALAGKQPLAAGLTALAPLATTANTMPYYNGIGTAAETPLTGFARALLDDDSAATALNTLGAQAVDPFLTSIAALGTVANKIIYTTGADTAAETTLTAFARNLLDDTDAATARATLGAFNIAGDTATGDILIGKALPKVALNSTSGNAFFNASSTSDSGFQLFHGSTDGGAGIRWQFKKTGDANSDLLLNRFNSSGGYLSTPASVTRSNGVIALADTYNNTSASSANVFIDSAGVLYRGGVSTSDMKADVEDVTDEYADKMFEFCPIFYRSLCAADNPAWGYYGYRAEDVARSMPHLVSYQTTKPRIVSCGLDEDGVEQFMTIHEPIAVPIPNGVFYDRFAPIFHNHIYRHRVRIEAVEKAINDLTSRLEKIEAQTS